jgi:hypothetical protein
MLEGPMVESNILLKADSDHCPVQFWIDTIATPKLKPFRFQKFWLIHPDFQELARTLWTNLEIQQGTKMFCFHQRIKKLQTTDTQMEQRGLWEHLSRKKIVGTKTRRPLRSNHTKRIHSHSTTRGEHHQEAT